jgi:hypothetical protein
MGRRQGAGRHRSPRLSGSKRLTGPAGGWRRRRRGKSASLVEAQPATNARAASSARTLSIAASRDRVLGGVEATRPRLRIVPPGRGIPLGRCRLRDDGTYVEIANLTGAVWEGRTSVKPHTDQIVAEHVRDLFS